MPRARSRFWQAAALGSSAALQGRGALNGVAPLSGLNLRSLTELTTIAAAATTDTTITTVANSIVVRVEVTVMTVIPTATTFNYGVAGATARYGTGIAVAATTTYPGTDAGPLLYASAVAIRFTPSATPGAATGKVQTTIWYYAP